MAAVSTRVPLVSVAIPAYCGEKYIAETIDSVLRQSLSDFELIVVDDHSPDATAAIVAGYADPRIRFYRNDTNLGPQGNWNRCLQESRGKYFKLLPQDDVLSPDCLERQVAVLEADETESIALVFCRRTVVSPAGRPLMVRGYAGSAGRIAGAVLQRKCVMYGTNLIGEPGAGLFRRTLASTIGGYDASNPYVVDLDYWFRLLAVGDAYYLKAALVTFRVSPGAWSSAIGKRQARDFVGFLKRVRGGLPFAERSLYFWLGGLIARINGWLRALLYRFIFFGDRCVRD